MSWQVVFSEVVDIIMPVANAPLPVAATINIKVPVDLKL